ncbi:MAG: transposase [Oscillospiraceae bacterium]|jgi:REP element-mobilizing transposase RayT|nr:transposase [Oscillospiraceae bacterium]
MDSIYLKRMITRKPMRLINYDYSQSGCYFVTICVKDGHGLLGKVVVGDVPLRVPCVELSEIGVIVDKGICKINTVYPCVFIDKYAIMPNHIHIIAFIKNELYLQNNNGTRGGTSPTTKSLISQKHDKTHKNESTTKISISRVVQSLKSITTKQIGFSMWQRSFHDHIIRNESDYLRIWQYIDENPIRWSEDKYYIYDNAAKVAFANLRSNFVSEAERLYLKNKDDVSEKMWEEKYANTD